MFVEKEKQVRQDWDAIAGFMARAGFPVDRQQGVQQFISGLANLNYLINLQDGRRAVLRRPPSGPLPPGGYDLSREFYIYSKLGKHLSFVPKGLVLCDDPNIIGVPFFVMEFCEGVALHKANVPESLASQPMIGDKLCQLIIHSLAELHKLDPEKVGLADFGNPEGFITRQVHGWKKRGVLALTKEQQPLMEILHEWLVCHEPVNRPIALVHHDYKLDNILIDPVRLEISGVIDWEMATVGDPFFDLALTLVVWGEKEDQNVYSPLSMMPCQLEGWWSRKKVLEVYQELTGLKITQEDWKFYWLLALMRMAVVFGQLANLYERAPYMESKSNPDFHLSPKDFSPLATETLEHGVKIIGSEEIDF
jgi:aminoglycoside phosphotransferase (APT) family kinase protein